MTWEIRWLKICQACILQFWRWFLQEVNFCLFCRNFFIFLQISSSIFCRGVTQLMSNAGLFFFYFFDNQKSKMHICNLVLNKFMIFTLERWETVFEKVDWLTAISRLKWAFQRLWEISQALMSKFWQVCMKVLLHLKT